MMDFISNPAAWAAIGVLLGALGIEFNADLIKHILAAIAAVAGIVGIVLAGRDARKE